MVVWWFNGGVVIQWWCGGLTMVSWFNDVVVV